MVSKKAKGRRAKTRDSFKRRNSKIAVNQHFVDWKPGTRVHIEVDGSFHSGIPFRRTLGKTGIVTGKRGKVYMVELIDGKTKKEHLIHPVHLKLAK